MSVKYELNFVEMGIIFSKKFWLIVQSGIWMLWELRIWKKWIFKDILGKEPQEDDY